MLSETKGSRVPTEAFEEALFRAIGRPELSMDERFRTRDARVRHVTGVDRLVSDFTRIRTKAEAVQSLASAGVPAAEVRNPAEAVRDPRVVGRGETVRLQHPADVYGRGVPIVFSDATVQMDQPPPEIGEHNQEIYGGLLGYSAAEWGALKTAGVI